MSLTQLPAWNSLKAHFEIVKNLHLRDLFAQNPERFKEFSIQFNDILVDYSKNRISNKLYVMKAFV